MFQRIRSSKFVAVLAVFGLVLTMALSTPLLGHSAEAARRGYDGPATSPNGQVGTLTITWAYTGGQSCIAYATLAGWDPDTTYTVEYAYSTPVRPVSGSVQLNTDATGAAYGRVAAVGRMFLVTFSVNGVTKIGYPSC